MYSLIFSLKKFFNILFVWECVWCVCVYEHLDACVWAGLWAPFERERFIRFCISNALMKCLLNWKGLHGLKVLWGNPVYIINSLGKFFLDSNKIQFLASLCPNLKFHLSEAPSSFCESVAWCHQSCLYFFSKRSWENSSLHAGSIAWSMRSIGPESFGLLGHLKLISPILCTWPKSAMHTWSQRAEWIWNSPPGSHGGGWCSVCFGTRPNWYRFWLQHFLSVWPWSAHLFSLRLSLLFCNALLSTEELRLLNCVVGEGFWESLGL